MTTTNDDREPLVYGPHRELYDLIETLEAALEQPRKRSAAIEEAITYLCKLHGLLFVLTDQMNDAARKASEEQPEIPG